MRLMRAMWRASCAETRLRRVLPPRDWRIVRHRCEAIADRMPPSDRSAASRFERLASIYDTWYLAVMRGQR